MRPSRHLAVGLVALSLVASTAASSEATTKTDGNGSFTVSAATTHSNACATSTISFTPAAGVTEWFVGVSVDNPDASAGPTFQLDEATPSHSLTFCPGTNQTGDYWVTGELSGAKNGAGETYLGSYRVLLPFRRIDPKPTAFSATVRRSHSATHCPLRQTHHCARIVGHLTRLGKPFPGQWTQIQVYKHGHWVRMQWQHVDGLGRVVWYLTITKKERTRRFRLFYPRTDAGLACASRAFHGIY